MAIKFTRKQPGADRPKISYEPPRLFGSAGPQNPKRRFFFIYITVGLVVALSLSNIRDRADTFENQPTLRGAATITAKQDGALLLEMNGIEATYKPEPEVFDRLNPGDHVAVLYQRSRTGRQIRILEIGTAPMASHP